MRFCASESAEFAKICKPWQASFVFDFLIWYIFHRIPQPNLKAKEKRMPKTIKKRAGAILLALSLLIFASCSNRAKTPPPPSPAPAEEIAGLPVPPAAVTPAPSPAPSPAAEPDYPAGPAEAVLPAAGTARYLKSGLPFFCPHAGEGLCKECVSAGAIPLPDSNRILAILRFLTAKSRRTGSEYCEISGEFIQNALIECGYAPYLQPVGTENTGYVFSGESALAFGETVLPMDYVFGGAQGVRSGSAVFCGEGYPLPESAEGAVLLSNGAGALSVIRALGLGTPAAVVAVNADETLAHSVPDLWPQAIVLATNDADLFKLVKSGDILTVSSTENGPFESANIVAELNPAAKETIILCAHYDSVSTTPGACDNAAGAAVLLELARTFFELGAKQRIVFLFTTGEEQGMLGASVFARGLSKEEQSSIQAVYVLDMFSDANQETPLVYTCDGEPNAAVALLSAACESHLLKKPLFGREFRSDHAPFYGIGLSAALCAQGESDELYHTPYDTMNKLSEAYIDLVFAWMAGILLG